MMLEIGGMKRQRVQRWMRGLYSPLSLDLVLGRRLSFQQSAGVRQDGRGHLPRLIVRRYNTALLQLAFLFMNHLLGVKTSCGGLVATKPNSQTQTLVTAHETPHLSLYPSTLHNFPPLESMESLPRRREHLIVRMFSNG